MEVRLPERMRNHGYWIGGARIFLGKKNTASGGLNSEHREKGG